MFFQSKPDIADHDKARLEFRLQQITDAVGVVRMQSSIQASTRLVPSDPNAKPEQILETIRDLTGHDFSGLKIQQSLDVLQPKSGGGG